MSKYVDCPKCHHNWDVSEGPRNARSPVEKVDEVITCPECGFKFKEKKST